MKNIIKGFLLSVAAITLFAGCAQENFSLFRGKSLVFTATIDQAATRTSIDANGTEGKVYWVEGDEITINGVTYVATPDDDPKEAVFTKKNADDADPEPIDGKYYAAFGFKYDATDATGTLVAVQKTSGSSLSNVPMYAESTTTSLSFKNICGLLEITLKGTEEVKSIRVSADNLAMSGNCAIVDGQTAVMSEAANAANVGAILDCTGTALSEDGVKFYVAVPAGEYEGFALRFESADGKVWCKDAVNKVSIEANKIYTLSFTPEFAQQIAASVDGKEYATIEEAVAAANAATADCTLKILSDCTSDAGLTISNNNAKVTVDLNHCTVSSPKATFTVKSNADFIGDETGKLESTGNFALIVNTADVTVNVNGGNYVGSAQYGAIRHYGKDAKMTITGNPQVVNTSTSGAAAINGGYDSSSSAGDITIESGKFICESGAALRAAYGNVTINGGTFIGGTYALTAMNGYIYVNDGYFYGEADDILDGSRIAGNVAGGYFNKEFPDAFLNYGHGISQLSTPATSEGKSFPYQVVEVAQHTALYLLDPSTSAILGEYTRASEAFAAAMEKGTAKLQLIADLVVDDVINIEVPCDITLDLHGYKFDCNTYSRVNMLNENATFTVIDSSEGAGQYNQTFSSYALNASLGTVNLEGIRMSSSAGSALINADSTAVINMKNVKATCADCLFNAYGRSTYNVDGGEYTSNLEGTASSSAAIYVRGWGSKGMPTVTIGGNAKINAAACAIYGSYANITLNDCEITAGTVSNVYAFYHYTGDVCDVNSGCSIVNLSSGAIFASGTGNAASKLNVNGGHFYAEGGMAVPTSGSYAKTIFINGGYFSNNKIDINTVLGTDLAIVGCSEKHTHGGVERDYAYTLGIDKSKAQVGDKKYDDINDAVAAANAATSAVTFKFLKGMSLENEIEFSNAVAEITVDINGVRVVAPNDNTKSAIRVSDGVVNIVDNSDGAAGILDHINTSTAYSVTVDGGTLNFYSGNIVNTTGTGYGRYALRVKAAKKDAYFNMYGGTVSGGRAISIGSGIAGRVAKATIYGGYIEGKTTNSGTYATICFGSDYGELVLCGGTVKSTKSCAIYSGQTNTKITVSPATGKKVFIYSGGSYAFSAKPGVCNSVSGWEYYSNVTGVESDDLDGHIEATELATKVKDENGLEYAYQCVGK